jgi:hypothetical protein
LNNIEDSPPGNFPFCFILILQIVSILALVLKLKSMPKLMPFPVHTEAGKKYISVSLVNAYFRIWGCVKQDRKKNGTHKNSSFFIHFFEIGVLSMLLRVNSTRINSLFPCYGCLILNPETEDTKLCGIINGRDFPNPAILCRSLDAGIGGSKRTKPDFPRSLSDFTANRVSSSSDRGGYGSTTDNQETDSHQGYHCDKFPHVKPPIGLMSHDNFTYYQQNISCLSSIFLLFFGGPVAPNRNG